MYEEIEAIVSGMVQGVRFRDFVQTQAGTLAVRGQVENLSDGTVRIIAQGSPEVLKAFIDTLHEGSVLARVEQVAVTWRAPTRTFADFSIIYP